MKEKGVDCKCGHFAPFGVYVMAHWELELIMTCPKCGRKYSVLEGDVELLEDK